MIRSFPRNILNSLLRWIILLALLLSPILLTLSDYGVTWDEPIYQEASSEIKKWLSLPFDEFFDPETIDRYWKTDPKRNVHPAGLKWMYLAAQKVIFWEDDPYRQNSILNILIISISLVIFLNWWSRDSIKRCIVIIVTLLMMPRFFAHVHFPATDVPMISLFLLFIVCMDRTIFKKGFILPGVILAFLLSIKITSVLLALPVFLLFIFKYIEDWKKIIPRIIFICVTAVLIFYIVNPDYWFSPVFRGNEFFHQTLTRKSWAPMSVLFNGNIYIYRGPFYYPFVMFLITTPVLHILLLFIGIFSLLFLRKLRINFKMQLISACFIFPFVILALPISPAHDGIRYLLPAYPFAACLITLGLEKLWEFVNSPHGFPLSMNVRKLITAAICLPILVIDLRGAARIPPFELSYYNSLVGGVRGAYIKGYETTYWWEIMNAHTLDRLNEICDGSIVYFPLSPTDLYFKHMTNNNKIVFRPTLHSKKADFMLIIGRPYVKFWEDRAINEFRLLNKIPEKRWGIVLDSIPLLQLYSIKDQSK